MCLLSSFSHARLFAILLTMAGQAALSMGFSRQEYWSGLPCPPSRGSSYPGIEPVSPALAGGLFTTSTTWEAYFASYLNDICFYSLTILFLTFIHVDACGFS